jgi:hypothetical protein
MAGLCAEIIRHLPVQLENMMDPIRNPMPFRGDNVLRTEVKD